MSPKLVKSPYSPKFYGGLVAQVEGLTALPGGALNSGLPGPQGPGSPVFRYGGLVTYEKPILEFPADIIIGASESRSLTEGDALPRNCVGCRFIDLVGAVYASINGGGPRKILNNDVLSGCELRSLFIATDAASGVTIQAVGTGD